MKLLISGANGFIGKVAVRTLSEQHEIVALVRDPSVCAPIKNVVFLKHDFSTKLETKLMPSKIDAVIHLAQSNQYRNFPEGMRDMADVNISGLVDMLDYARNAQCDQFINYSSGSVYTTDPDKQHEEASIKPTSAYPLSKYIGEQITDLYSDYFHTLNVRLFFPYGPGQAGMLIPNIIDSVANRKPIGLQGDQGGLVLCPIYVDDVISFCANSLKQKVSGLINLAGPESLTLEDIAFEIAKHVGQEPIFEINLEATPARFQPSLERLQNVLNSNSLIKFAQGIENTITA